MTNGSILPPFCESAGRGELDGSRQERRQLSRGLAAMMKTKLSEHEMGIMKSLLNQDLMPDEAKLSACGCDACQCPSKPGERLRSCHKCGLVRYCNRDCQVAAWPIHKLVCKVLAADREIAAAKFSESTSLLPLDRLTASLCGSSHAEAYEAATHLYMMMLRTDTVSADPISGRSTERSRALRDKLVPPQSFAALVSGLAKGGLRTTAAARVFSPLVADRPELGAAMVAAGALPSLVYAIELPFKHAGLDKFWGLRAATLTATGLLDSLTLFPSLRLDIIDAGAIPALGSLFSSLMREGPPPAHWPDHLKLCIGGIEALKILCPLVGGDEGVHRRGRRPASPRRPPLAFHPRRL